MGDIFGKDFELFGKKDDEKEKDSKKDKNSVKNKDSEKEKDSDKSEKNDELPQSEASTIVDVVSENLPETDEEAAAKKDKQAKAQTSQVSLAQSESQLLLTDQRKQHSSPDKFIKLAEA